MGNGLTPHIKSMREIHKDVFDKATDIFDEDGFEAARNYLIEQTKKPYKAKRIVPIEMPAPKIELKPIDFSSRFNEMQNYKIPKKKPRDFPREFNLDRVQVKDFLNDTNVIPETGFTSIIPQSMLDLMNRSSSVENVGTG